VLLRVGAAFISGVSGRANISESSACKSRSIEGRSVGSSSCASSKTEDGNEGQLESVLSSEEFAVGVLMRELDVVVLEERDLDERLGSNSGSAVSGSMISTTFPSGATTS
jgi:hypothetical protein